MRTQMQNLLRANEVKNSKQKLFIGYGFLFMVASLLMQAWLNNWSGHPSVFWLFPPILFIAWHSGFIVAVSSLILTILLADFFLFEPLWSLEIYNKNQIIILGSFFFVSLVGARIFSRLSQNNRSLGLLQSEFEMTLKSIGDAVLVVDHESKISFMNPVAENLTGWTLNECRGKFVQEVFRIFDYETRTPAANPVEQVLKYNKSIQLTKRTLLISKIGNEYQIEDSAAPIWASEKELTPIGVVLIFRDVTQKYLAEAAYHENDERLRLALSSAKLGTFYIRLDSFEVITSPELASTLGITNSGGNMLALMEQVIHPDDRSKALSNFNSAIEKRNPYEDEFRIILPSGEIRWLLSRAKIVYDKQGNAIAVSGATLDINDLKVAEEQLRASERRFATLFNSSPLATAITRMPDGVFTDVNPAFEELLEYKREEIIGKTSHDLKLLIRPERRAELLKELKDTGQVRGAEFEARTRSGKTISVVNSVNVVELDGASYILTSLLDITKLREAEKALREKEQAELRESEKRFRDLVNTLPQMTWLADHSGAFYWYNERWYNYTGTNLPEMEGWGWQKLLHPEHLHRVNQWWDEVRTTGQPGEIEFPLRNSEGQYRWFLTHVVPIKDDFGNVVKWCGTNTDIQEQKMYEANLAKSKDAAERAQTIAEQAQAEAERANTLKSAFLANMSHEIRTPLGAMIGFADLLRNPNLSSSERLNYINILARNGESLSVIINDILDLSKVEAGHLTMEYTDVYPQRIAEDIVALLHVKAIEKNITLTYECEATTPVQIVSDPYRVRQILLNLVGNAIKFTQRGSVRIRSYGGKSNNDMSAVFFEIADTGIGIPESHKDKVFKIFVQADSSMTRRFGGTGLGLALSRRLATALGGNIELLKSDVGQGSTFLVSIEDQPLRRNTTKDTANEKKEEAPIKQNSLKDLNVLLVDDSSDNRMLIGHYLGKQGAQVDTADNGITGYQKALSGNYDVVLMDIQMPEMDGYTATYNLRTAGYQKPIIALTAHAMTEFKQKCLNVGCTNYLSKPVNPQKLISMITDVVER